jgi:hypothetical protein
MALLKCGTTTAQAVFDELVELGFIECRRESSFDLKTKETREWAITAEPENGKPAERTFKRWQPPLEKRTTGPAARPHRSRSETRGDQTRPPKRPDGSRGET